MQTYIVELKSDPSTGFFATKAANSVDLKLDKALTHRLEINADIESPFNVGLIFGSSGSGKTTLAKQIYGDNCFLEMLDKSKPVIEQFNEELSYDQRVEILTGVGLSQVPCWVRPAAALSNGQQFRAEIALQIANNKSDVIVIDEWTSVVDRTVAKAMSFTIAKYARRVGKKIVLLSCHYDVVEWLNPCWIIDCNKQEYQDRRLLWRDFKREETFSFSISECERSTWRNFSKYHYLSENLPGSKVIYFGLFLNGNQIGFICYANYVPRQKGTVMKMHANRLVIHPDYCGFGLGVRFLTETAKIVSSMGYKVYSKFSSVPVARSVVKNPNWRLKKVTTAYKKRPKATKSNSNRPVDQLKVNTTRTDCRTTSFIYIGSNL